MFCNPVFYKTVFKNIFLLSSIASLLFIKFYCFFYEHNRNIIFYLIQEFAGITKDMIAKVEYKSKSKETPKDSGQTPSIEVISEAQRKRLYAIYKGAGKSDDEVKVHLHEKYKVESSKEILKKDYEEICKWAETKDREPGEE